MISGATRRGLLAAAAGAAMCRPARARAGAGAAGRLLVAGPAGGRLDALAAALLPALVRAGGDVLDVQAVGGEDGVTGANQFAARFDGEGEGTPLLLLPGAAAAAWIAGDPRVQYDAARWLPLLCGLGSGVFASRRAPGSARPAEPWRVAVPDPLGAGAACLLGLDLLATPALPVRTGDPAAALRAGQVDAAFLPGPAAVTVASSAGANPVFWLGLPDAGGDVLPWPAVPSLVGLLQSRAAEPMLSRALGAVSAAALLDYALVVPALTPAPAVARWREAVSRVAGAPDLAASVPAGVRSLAAPACGATQAAIALDPATLLAYRRWLGRRLTNSAG